MPGSHFSNLFGWKQGGPFDERFMMHRFKSTRLAVLAGTILLFALFTYHAAVDKTLRWDLFSVLAAMALVKAAAMLYYRRTN